MSNVLIGIIGVILFIGLALAGALILGDDFRSATSSTKAATLMSNMKQVSDAVNMYRLKTGKEIYEGEETLLVPRFLKVYPYAPIGGPGTSNYRYQVALNNRQFDNASATPGNAAKYVTIQFQNNVDASLSHAQAKALCTEIAEQNGAAAMTMAGQAGCFNYGSAYVAFVKL